MHVLVINSGSTSLKFSLFAAEDGEPRPVFEGEVSDIGGSRPKSRFCDASGSERSQPASTDLRSMDDAVAWMTAAIGGPGVPRVDAVGYRVVHPGPRLRDHLRIDDRVIEELRRAAEFAPLHDPGAVAIIEQMRKRLDGIGHYACFDTVFHQTMPAEATHYPLPSEYAAEGVRRYGFHGLSCESIVHRLRASNGQVPRRMAIAHLGGGCSVTALVDGLSVDTSMGLTPTGGVVMATRPGDLDPGLVLYLVRRQGADAVEALLNRKAGLAGASAISADMREVRAAAAKGNEQAELALRIFTRSVTKALGSCMALLGGLEAIVFSGGIGEHDAASRAEIVAGLRTFGVRLDRAANADNKNGSRTISEAASDTAVHVVPAEEDLAIARHVVRMAQAAQPNSTQPARLEA